MPLEIKRYYEVHIRAPSKWRPFTIREVKASCIGQLVRISGIVTRCSDVKPLMQVAVYTCEECGYEIFQDVTTRVFMPLFECPSKLCFVNRKKGNLILQLRASKFLKFQEAKIQELAEHVPKGHIPRSMIGHFRGEMTGKQRRHQILVLEFRLTETNHELDNTSVPVFIINCELYFRYELRGDEEEQIAKLAEDGNIYNKLAQLLAPEIYGHEYVKKALLLLLVGAPYRKLKDGMKSASQTHYKFRTQGSLYHWQRKQWSWFNCSCAERSCHKLDGPGIGSLAIHEVKEQQTLSIAKVGITTSLNARIAILAAASPAWGRYDLRRTPAENINLPPALLSIFYLLWLTLDRADMDTDLEMARHVVYVHQNRESPALGFTPLEPSVLR
ncbi:hypothetical protein GOBAR_DD20518 [Gossypium barbadense]|nr:hypothetical protein GOBAR_DD20518 [Gossypium barbadense]